MGLNIDLRGLELTTGHGNSGRIQARTGGDANARADAQELLDAAGRGRALRDYVAEGRRRGWDDKRLTNAINAGVEAGLFRGRPATGAG